jgi:nucleoside-diphosphate-sugar epimerase
VVSGASGWLGRSALEALDCSIPKNKRIIGLSRISGVIVLDSGRNVELVTYENANDLMHVECLVQAAFPTQNQLVTMGQSVYEDQCKSILVWLHKFIEVFEPQKIVGISSGVVSQDSNENSNNIDQLGLYKKWKIFEENLLLESKCQNVVVGRLFSTSGRFMTNPESYALGSLILNGIRNEPIQVNSKLLTIRNYIDAEDFTYTLLYAAESQSRLVLESAGITISVPDLASEVSRFFPGSYVTRMFESFAGEDRYLPTRPENYLKFSMLAGIQEKGIAEQIAKTIAGIRGRFSSE